MTVKQVAERLEVSTATVYSLVAGGKLRHYRVGNGRGVVRVSDEQLAEYLREAESQRCISADQPKSSLKHLRLP